MKIEFDFDKETKNTIRFYENEENPILNTIYIQKWALDELGYNDGDTIIVNISVK